MYSCSYLRNLVLIPFPSCPSPSNLASNLSHSSSVSLESGFSSASHGYYLNHNTHSVLPEHCG
jgi:hypothetical protein